MMSSRAKAGSTADDGDGMHSPFTTAVLKNLTVPGLDVRLAFGRVRDEVLKTTGSRQEPFVYGSLGGEDVPGLDLNAAPPVVIMMVGLQGSGKTTTTAKIGRAHV